MGTPVWLSGGARGSSSQGCEFKPHVGCGACFLKKKTKRKNKYITGYS